MGKVVDINAVRRMSESPNAIDFVNSMELLVETFEGTEFEGMVDAAVSCAFEFVIEMSKRIPPNDAA